MKNKLLWKSIPNYPGYFVSNTGLVKSIDRKVKRKDGCFILKHGTILSPSLDDCGYKYVCLSKNNNQKCIKIHRLVAISFIGKIKKGYEVNHKNFKKKDNRVKNLEVITRKENIKHAVKGRRFFTKKFKLSCLARRGKSYKYSKKIALNIVKLRRNKLKHIEISEKLSVPISHIQNVLSGNTWSHETKIRKYKRR